jgi:hypothetical protein
VAWEVSLFRPDNSKAKWLREAQTNEHFFHYVPHQKPRHEQMELQSDPIWRNPETENRNTSEQEILKNFQRT